MRSVARLAEYPVIRDTPGRYPPHRGKHLAVILNEFVFADESGIDKADSFCVVLGYIGSFDEWNRIDAAWSAILDRFGVECFHAKDFFGRKEPYRVWTEEHCDIFLEQLLEVVQRSDIRPVGGAIDNAAFFALSTGERRVLTGGRISDKKLAWKGTEGAPTKPWHLGFHFLIVDALDHTEPNTMVHFIFDQQQLYQQHAIKVFGLIRDREVEKYQLQQPSRVLSLGDIRFASKQRLPPLQATDLYTHAWYSFLTRNVDQLAKSDARRNPLTVGSRRGRALSALIPQRLGLPTYGAEDMEANLSQYSPEIRAWLKVQT